MKGRKENDYVLENIWNRNKDQHEKLVSMGFVHLTLTKRVGGVRKKNLGTYQMFLKGLIVVISSEGLVFLGKTNNPAFGNFGQMGFKKVNFDLIEREPRFLLGEKEELVRFLNPLYFLPLLEEKKEKVKREEVSLSV